MQASDNVCDTFKEVTKRYKDFARLGAITRSGDKFTVQLLTKFRDEWDDQTAKRKTGQKLTFVLGWLAHRAADRQMKPVFRELDGDCQKSPRDCSVYHDAFIFHEVFAIGKNEPYSPATFETDMASLAVAEYVDVEGVEDFFRALLQRALIDLHTFIPDRENIEDWLEGLFEKQQRFYVDLDRYAKAIYDPDPDMMRRFIEEGNFYSHDDKIIQVARRLQRGEEVSGDEVREAGDSDVISHYALAIKKGFGYLRAASEFFVGDMSPEILTERLDIGNKGRDGQNV